LTKLSVCGLHVRMWIVLQVPEGRFVHVFSMLIEVQMLCNKPHSQLPLPLTCAPSPPPLKIYKGERRLCSGTTLFARVHKLPPSIPWIPCRMSRKEKLEYTVTKALCTCRESGPGRFTNRRSRKPPIEDVKVVEHLNVSTSRPQDLSKWEHLNYL